MTKREDLMTAAERHVSEIGKAYAHWSGFISIARILVQILSVLIDIRDQKRV